MDLQITLKMFLNKLSVTYSGRLGVGIPVWAPNLWRPKAS